MYIDDFIVVVVVNTTFTLATTRIITIDHNTIPLQNENKILKNNTRTYTHTYVNKCIAKRE